LSNGTARHRKLVTTANLFYYKAKLNLSVSYSILQINYTIKPWFGAMNNGALTNALESSLLVQANQLRSAE
jgi:hypothetical protein